MQYTSILLLLVLLLIDHIHGARKRSNKSPEDIAEEKLFDLIGKSVSSPINYLSDRNFTNYVVDKPRFYHAAILLTARDARYQCVPCEQSEASFKTLAKHYHMSYDIAGVEADERVIFFVLDVDTSRKTFGSLEIETVPRFYVLPPRPTVNAPKVKTSEYEMATTSSLQGLSSFMNEFNRVSGLKLEPRVEPQPILLIIGMFSAIFALLASISEGDVIKLINIFRSSWIWMVVSILCFGFGVSGSVYCIIRNAPPFSHERDGTINIWGQGSRDQTVLEGIAVAFYTISCAIAMFLVYIGSGFANTWTNIDINIPYLTKGKTIKLPIPGWLVNIMRNLLVCAGLALFIVMGKHLCGAYLLKTQWYRISETLPPYIWQPLSSNVRKTSGLLKRLFRMSNVLLWEFKDWNSFQKKAKLLVVDYIYKSIGMTP